jgi:hypothetical protein
MIEQFQDDSKIGSETNGDRNSSEYWSTGSGNSAAATTELLLHWDNNWTDSSGNNVSRSYSANAPDLVTTQYKFGTHAPYFDGNDYVSYSAGDGGNWFGSGDWAYDFWARLDSNFASSQYRSYMGHNGQDSSNYHQLNTKQTTLYLHTYNDVLDTTDNIMVVNTWKHVLVQRYNNKLKIWVDGNLCAPTGGLSLSKNFNTNNDWSIGWDSVQSGKFVGYMDEYRMVTHAPTVTSGDVLYTGNDTGNFTPPTTPYVVGTPPNATGTLISTANTASASQTKVSGVMLYKDSIGTSTIGTDLKIYFTCNGGTNWTEAASYGTVSPVFSTGVKMIRLGNTTCTAGTDVRYKAVWANQSTSKLTQLHGIGMNY